MPDNCRAFVDGENRMIMTESDVMGLVERGAAAVRTG
jgi:hypothetical protein